MRDSANTKAETMTDFEHVINAFVANLEELADHIESHDLFVGAKRTAEQARVAAQMLRFANAFEGPPLPDVNAPQEVTSAWCEKYIHDEDEAWSEAWAYVAKHIREWWD